MSMNGRYGHRLVRLERAIKPGDPAIRAVARRAVMNADPSAPDSEVDAVYADMLDAMARFDPNRLTGEERDRFAFLAARCDEILADGGWNLRRLGPKQVAELDVLTRRAAGVPT